MRPAHRLDVLHRAFDRRLDRLHECGLDLLTEPSPQRARLIASYTCVEAMNAWEQFARSYFLSCVIRARTVGGNRVASTISGLAHSAALGRASAALPPQLKTKYGPNWKKIDTIDTLATCFNFTNRASVASAAAYPTDVLDDLNRARNFQAHKCLDTRNRALSIAYRRGIPAGRDILSIIVATNPITGNVLLLDWLADLRVLARLLCQ